MRRRRAALAVAAGVVAALVGAAPAGAARGGPCFSSKSETILQEGNVRVIESYSGWPYACFRGIRRSVELIRYAGRPPAPEDFDIAGRFVAVTGWVEGADGLMDDEPVFRVVDVRRARRVYSADTSPEGFSALEVVLRRNGSFAWIERGVEPPGGPGAAWVYSVRVNDAGGERVLETSRDIDPESLALAGARIYWMRGGAAQTAVLR